MKKLALVLAAATAISSQASAEIRSGFYLGANVSANALLADSKRYYTSEDGTDSNSLKHDGGAFGAGLGIYGGYGLLSGCMYYAGEIAWDWNSAKISHKYTDSDAISSDVAKIKVEKNNYFNFAAIIGRKVNPSTVLYIRLGGNVGKTELKSSIDDSGAKLSKSKTEISFVPGIGMETSFDKNWVGRMEYTYDLGNSVSKRVTDEDGNIHRLSSGKVANHAVKLGVSYRF